MGIQMNQTSFSPACRPFFTLAGNPAPIFCAVKFDTPFPSVVKEVITRLLSLTAAEYPAVTLMPKLLITLWIKIFPTEIKDCCKILGIAITASF